VRIFRSLCEAAHAAPQLAGPPQTALPLPPPTTACGSHGPPCSYHFLCSAAMATCADILGRHPDEWKGAVTHPFLTAVQDGTILAHQFEAWLGEMR